MGGSKNHVAPRNSLSMFSAERKGMSNLNNSKSSINSSTRSLQKDSPKTTRRATTSTLDNKRVTPSRYVGSSTSNLRNGYSNNVMKPTTSTPNITARSSPMRITSSATMNLTPASPQKARRTTTNSTSSFMKPTTSSAKKLSATPLATPATMKSHNAPGTGNSRTTTITSTRLTATRPSRR